MDKKEPLSEEVLCAEPIYWRLDGSKIELKAALC